MREAGGRAIRVSGLWALSAAPTLGREDTGRGRKWEGGGQQERGEEGIQADPTSDSFNCQHGP